MFRSFRIDQNTKYLRPTFTLYYNLNDPRVREYEAFSRFMNICFKCIDFLAVNNSKYENLGIENVVQNWPCVSIRCSNANPEIVKGFDPDFLIKKAIFIKNSKQIEKAKPSKSQRRKLRRRKLQFYCYS